MPFSIFFNIFFVTFYFFHLHTPQFMFDINLCEGSLNLYDILEQPISSRALRNSKEGQTYLSIIKQQMCVLSLGVIWFQI